MQNLKRNVQKNERTQQGKYIKNEQTNKQYCNYFAERQLLQQTNEHYN